MKHIMFLAVSALVVCLPSSVRANENSPDVAGDYILTTNKIVWTKDQFLKVVVCFAEGKTPKETCMLKNGTLLVPGTQVSVRHTSNKDMDIVAVLSGFYKGQSFIGGWGD